jgi:hypothetical protein
MVIARRIELSRLRIIITMHYLSSLTSETVP